ncbi:putative zinc finger, CCHC-type, caulimovirus coat protein [Tanacetum coccineum]
MKPGNKVFSITYLVAYALTSSHHSIDYKKKEYIEIDDLFNEIGSVEGSKFATIKPIDETWAIDIAKNKKRGQRAVALQEQALDDGGDVIGKLSLDLRFKKPSFSMLGLRID